MSSRSATASTTARAVLAVRGALVTAARAGRTAGPGEVSSAAYGAWVPGGLPHLLAEVARACRERGEPDLTSLVVPRGRRARYDDHNDDGDDDGAAAERRACWQRWAGPQASASSSASSASSAPRTGAFGERGVVCPDCLVVVSPAGACRCCPVS